MKCTIAHLDQPLAITLVVGVLGFIAYKVSFIANYYKFYLFIIIIIKVPPRQCLVSCIAAYYKK